MTRDLRSLARVQRAAACVFIAAVFAGGGEGYAQATRRTNTAHGRDAGSADAAAGGVDAGADAGGGTFVTSAGWISMVPPGNGWRCNERAGRNEHSEISEVRCERTAPGEFLAITAKDTQVLPADVLTAEALSNGRYRHDNERYYGNVRYAQSRATRYRGIDGWEVEFDASEPRGSRTVHATERVIVVGRHVFYLAALGTPADFDRMRRDVERWFDNVRFANLR